MSNLSLADSKPHYAILDALRGVGALVVILFHALEIHSDGNHAAQLINHGYLAVDFFFMLSGYVIGYAYDDRWGQMTLKDFFLRRLIRLQPMVIAGSVVGAALFYLQDSPALGWELSGVPVGRVLLLMVIGATLLPVGRGLDIRGWHEMHPLNGPAWSLFFEYIANLTYALVLRRVSKAVLWVLTAAAAALTVHYALTNAQGDLIGGWSIDDAHQMRIGFTRLAFPFLAGLLMARVGRLRHIRHAFLLSSVILVAALAVPRLGGTERLWLNGLYECLCLLVVFPLVVWIGAGGTVKGRRAKRLCKFLGDISYPIYITHFPIMCIYMGFVTRHRLTLAQSWPWAVVAVVASIAVAYTLLKLYDEPVRERLRNRFLRRK